MVVATSQQEDMALFTMGLLLLSSRWWQRLKKTTREVGELIVGLLLVRSWWWHHLKKAQDIGDFRDRTHHCGLHCGGSVVEALAAMSLTQLP